MKVLLIDDDIELVELLTEYLSSHGFSITAYHRGDTGLSHAQTHDYDVILLDVMLPGIDGFEVLKQLRQTKLTPVIMLTAKGEDFDRIFGLELGADDYLAKPFNHRELLARVKAITRRIENIQQLANNSLEENGIRLTPHTREAFAAENKIELTGTEFEILFLLLNNQGEIVSKEAISEQVLGRKLAPFDRSIDMHVSNIRKKIAEHIEQEKIKTVRGAGYILLGSA
ncbi:response regulator transcription factor [Pseudoalteromonas sp. G4]|uniref:response regulator transcription factor n=1 Tax=Pseudoalteromonas sp. G4 TaxID=2992761 RepID=UPI00237E4715|nr:response regulator transcription factor [Pseudoalteromonas sp. G4]MDE3271651.1 response regulator transcription factor [Pseudoalteromonas sp. G4]